MMIRPIGRKPWIVVAILAIALGCQTAPEQKSAPGNLPGQMPMSQEPRVTATTYLAHGHLLERQGQFERAVVQYQKALRMQPDFVTARNRLGIALNKLGRHHEASEQFRQALRVKGDAPFLHNNLGFSLYLEGRYADAEAALQEALRLKSEYARAHMNYALVLAKLDRFREVESELAQACDPPDVFYNLGILLTEAQRYAEAARALERALSLRPDYEAARAQLHEVARLAAEWEAYQAAHALAADAGRESRPDNVAARTTVPQNADETATVTAVGTETSGQAPNTAAQTETPGELVNQSETGDASVNVQTTPEQARQEVSVTTPAAESSAETRAADIHEPAVLDDQRTFPPNAVEFEHWGEIWDWVIAGAAPDRPASFSKDDQPCDETNPDQVAVYWLSDRHSNPPADDVAWITAREAAPDATWPARSESDRTNPSESQLDPQLLAALLDEVTRSWRQGAYEEFERLWCRLGYVLFPETAPTGPQLSPDRLIDQRNLEKSRESMLAK